MLATVAGVSAQEATALFDLTDRDTFDQCTQFSDRYEHDDYSVWNFDTYSKAPVMYNDNLTEPYYSDYLLSPEITLQACSTASSLRRRPTHAARRASW